MKFDGDESCTTWWSDTKSGQYIGGQAILPTVQKLKLILEGKYLFEGKNISETYI